MNVVNITASALADSELVLQFESLGDNCELGLVQRRVGVEPLGLFRFAGAPVRHLIRALNADFAGMADPEHVRVQPENGEYMIKLTQYNFIYHAHVKIGDADPQALHRQQARTVGFLIDKLREDLRNPTKILVFRQNETVSANDLFDLRFALAAYGPSTLLWVQETRPGFPPGTVVVVDDTLMIGYVSRLATRANAPDFDLGSWLNMLRRAYAMRQAAPATLPNHRGAPPRIDTIFGTAGNAAGQTGFGWSAPEDGFTWAVDDSSLLLLPNPGGAREFSLEMDVVPFVAPPGVPEQTLDVAVNGAFVHRFDPVERGTIRCVVPGRLLEGQEVIEIILEHPKAAAPSAVTGEDDDRRLALAFRSLSLTGA